MTLGLNRNLYLNPSAPPQFAILNSQFSILNPLSPGGAAYQQFAALDLLDSVKATLQPFALRPTTYVYP